MALPIVPNSKRTPESLTEKPYSSHKAIDSSAHISKYLQQVAK